MMYNRRKDARRRSGRLAPRGTDATVSTLERRVLLSAYYVATDGSDAAAGTLDDPLRTVQAAANRAQAGDVVHIRGGVYRETVAVPRSGTASAPIVFQPYQNETVTISGADPLTGWSRHAGAIHKAAQGWDLGTGNNQVFVDGQMMTEARWPNTTLDVSRPKKETADAVTAMYAGDASYAKIVDDEMAGFPAGTWEGGTVHIASGESWVTQTGTVTDFEPGELSFDYVQRLNPKSGRFETPRAGDPYFLTGKFVALDAAGEWFFDGGDDLLYLWTPAGDSPAGHSVEVKRREYAFDLSGRSNVTVKGLDLFAATVVTDSSSSNIVIDGIDAKYVGHFWNSATGWEVPQDSGILLAGTDSVVRNSTIGFGAGHGIMLTGARNRAENNVIHDVAYSGANGAAIRAFGPEHLVRNNTIYNAGRSGILHSRVVRGRVLHNLIHDVMLQTTDGGGIYTYGTDGQGTEIAYNRVYNVQTGGFGGVGVYLDNGSANHVVHHNLTYNVTHAAKLNPPSLNNQLFNNTFVGTSRGVATSGTKDMTGTLFRNNIFTRQVDIGSTAVQEANVYAGTDPQFVDPAGGDYRLKSTSPAIDRGVRLAPYTDGYTGGGPDAGAFEFGKTPWAAGASSSLQVPDTTDPASPRGLTAVATAAGNLLAWNHVLDGDRMGYHVYRGTSASGPFTRLTATPTDASKYLDSAAPLDVASYYRVAAIDSSGNLSANATAGATARLPSALPGAVADLKASPASAMHVDLAWTAVPDVIRYLVERKGPGETSFGEVARVDGPGYRDAGLTPGATYSYRVRAENLRGVADATGAMTVSGTPLGAPSGLSIAVASGMRADLSWTNVPGETAYYVQRSPDGQGGWLNVGYNTPDVTTFSDLSVPTDEGFYYRVVALGPAGFSQPSNVVTAAPRASGYSSADIASTPDGRTTVVAADTAFDIAAGGRNISGTSDGFRFVYKSITGDFDVTVRLTGLTAVVSTTKAGLMARESLGSNSRNVFSHAVANGDLRYSRRLATAGDTAAVTNSTRGAFPNVWLRLRRQGNVFNAFGSVNGTTWVQTGSDTLDVGDTVLVGMAVSAQSTTQTTTAKFRELTQSDVEAPVVPAAPTGVSATAASPAAIDLRWSASAGAASYRVERRGPGETSFAEIAGGVAGTSYRDNAVQPQGAYAYRVRAQNGAGMSGYSATASATTPAPVPEAPSGLVVEAVSGTVVELEWSTAAGATSYRVERRGPGEPTFTQIAAGLTANGYTDATVAPESAYSFRVRAENGSGLSPYGGVASVTTPAVVAGAYRGADVGNPTPAGSTTTVTDGSAYDVTAGGTDIIGSTDRFHFAHQQRTGDFDVKVRVASLERAHEWTKAGLMARESLSAGSRNVFVMATPDINGYRMSSRYSDGGTTVANGVGLVSYPNTWLRLKRVGEVFTGYRSADGLRWTLVGSRSLTLPETVYFGMAVTSHNAQRTTVAQFRDLGDVPPEAPTAPAAPTGLAASSPSSTQVNLAWNAPAGATGYRVERKGPGEGDFVEVARVTGPSYADGGRAEASAYDYRVRAENSLGPSAYSAVVTVTTRAAYRSADISGSPAGSTNVVSEGAAYDVSGGGPDIFGQTDGFRFVYRQVSGDFDVKVRLQSLSAADASARAGLMARESLANNSRNAFASATAADGYRFTARTATNENTSLFKTGTVSYPKTWVRLRRTGDLFTGYFSNDGQDWTEVSSALMALPQTLYVGMAVSSFNTGSTATSEFRDLQ